MKTTLTKDDSKGWYLCEFWGRTYVRWWDGENFLRRPNGIRYGTPYTNFRRLYTEEEAAAMGQRFDELFAANQTLQFQVSTLTSDLEKLKASPYPMRKAERPDCVGLWRDKDGVIFNVVEDQLHPTYWAYPPYYYLGPIPVIPAEQKPPQVVTVRNKRSGEVFRAIPSPCGNWLGIVGDDGSYLGNESVDNWEVTQ